MSLALRIHDLFVPCRLFVRLGTASTLVRRNKGYARPNGVTGHWRGLALAVLSSTSLRGDQQVEMGDLEKGYKSKSKLEYFTEESKLSLIHI